MSPLVLPPFNHEKYKLTNKLKHFLKILPKVLLAVVRRRQPFVSQPGLDVVQGQVGGDVDHVADVEVPQQVQVLGVSLVPQIEKGKDGADHSILCIGGRHALVGQGRGQRGGERQRETHCRETGNMAFRRTSSSTRIPAASILYRG